MYKQPHNIDPLISNDHRTNFQRSRDNFFASLSYAVLVCAILFGILFIWWTVQPSNVVDIDERPIKVAEQYSLSKDEITVPIELCKRLPLEAKVNRSFVSDTTTIILPEVQEDLPVGCYTRSITVPIPPQVVPGTYIIIYDAEYRINPIKTTKERFETEPFRIVE